MLFRQLHNSTTSKMSLRLLTTVVFMYLYLDTSSGGNKIPEYAIEPETVSNIFNLLKEIGKEELDEFKNQYLTVAVISKSELMNSKKWKLTDIEHLKNSGRVKTFLNEKKEGEKKPFHGEMRFLTDENAGMKRMIQQLKEEKGDKEYPYIIMFSHYIPCAYIKGIDYSCSEELANIANTYQYKMLVGYSEVFHNTAENTSKAFLHSGSIQAFRKIAEAPGYELILYDVVKSNDESFQRLYFNCMRNKPISDCCNYDDNDTKNKVVAVFVNTVTKLCTENSQAVGRITRRNRQTLLDCIYNYIDMSIGHDCEQCKNDIDVKFIARFCAYAAVVQPVTLYLGVAEDMHDTTWKKFIGPWNMVYSSAKISPEIPCLKKDNAVGSMCTKRKQDFLKILNAVPKEPGNLQSQRDNYKRKLKNYKT